MEIVNSILAYIIQGGAGAIIALLFGVIIALIYDRHSLTKSLHETTQKVFDLHEEESDNILEIIEKYHQGNLNLVQALNEIKIVLVALQNRR